MFIAGQVQAGSLSDAFHDAWAQHDFNWMLWWAEGGRDTDELLDSGFDSLYLGL